jgi:hypothetical protein
MTTDAERLFETGVRVEQIIWLPGAVAEYECAPEVFSEEFVDNLPEREDAELYQQLPRLARFAGEYPEPEEVAEELMNTAGFIVQAATPVREYHADGGSSYSWGMYRTGWLYAATEAEIAPVVLAWAEKQKAAMKAKAPRARPPHSSCKG